MDKQRKTSWNANVDPVADMQAYRADMASKPINWSLVPTPLPSDANLRKVYETTYYQVNEQFVSIQGEGALTGTPSTFIRLQGCSVGCSWCDSGPLADLVEGRMTNGDTRNTWGRGGRKTSLASIVQGIRTRHVVITGGEPTIWNLDPIIQAAWDLGCVVQLETSGQNALKGSLVPDWITWSPKANLEYTISDRMFYQVAEVKWVVDEHLEWSTVWQWHSRYQMEARTIPIFSLMPEGSPPKQESIDKCLNWLNHLPMKFQEGWRYSHRLQYALGVR